MHILRQDIFCANTYLLDSLETHRFPCPKVSPQTFEPLHFNVVPKRKLYGSANFSIVHFDYFPHIRLWSYYLIFTLRLSLFNMISSSFCSCSYLFGSFFPPLPIFNSMSNYVELYRVEKWPCGCSYMASRRCYNFVYSG